MSPDRNDAAVVHQERGGQQHDLVIVISILTKGCEKNIGF